MGGWAGQSIVPVGLVFLTAPTRPALPSGFHSARAHPD